MIGDICFLSMMIFIPEDEITMPVDIFSLFYDNYMSWPPCILFSHRIFLLWGGGGGGREGEGEGGGGEGVN
jgi:hypothetical protein